MKRLLRPAVRLFLRSPRVRNWISVGRCIYFTRIRRREVRVLAEVSAGVSEHAVFSNLRRVLRNDHPRPHPRARYLFGVDTKQSGNKSDLLLGPLSAIDRVRENLHRYRILSIGPRTEGELLNIVAYGFRKRNVTGVDLFSYSPWIELGDMHALAYPDDSFDVVLCGWAFGYSEAKGRAAAEVVRVLRDGGFVALGVTYSPRTRADMIAERGFFAASEEAPLRTTADVEALFGEHFGCRYFAHDIEPERRDRAGFVLCVFSIRKRAVPGGSGEGSRAG